MLMSSVELRGASPAHPDRACTSTWWCTSCHAYSHAAAALIETTQPTSPSIRFPPHCSEVPAFGPEATALLDKIATSFSVEDAQEVRPVAPTAWARQDVLGRTGGGGFQLASDVPALRPGGVPWPLASC